MSDFEHHIADLDAEIERISEQQTKLMEERRALNELRTEQVTELLNTLTNEDLKRNDYYWFRFFTKEGDYNLTIHNRMHAMYKPSIRGINVDGFDGRDEYWPQMLPSVQLMLNKGQDIAAVHAHLLAWCQNWALGRPDLIIDILEHDLSEYGSWNLYYDIKKDHGQVYRNNRSAKYNIAAEGTLWMCLEYIAKELWYE